jgi:hypothetical protein
MLLSLTLSTLHQLCGRASHVLAGQTFLTQAKFPQARRGSCRFHGPARSSRPRAENAHIPRNS